MGARARWGAYRVTLQPVFCSTRGVCVPPPHSRQSAHRAHVRQARCARCTRCAHAHSTHPSDVWARCKAVHQHRSSSGPQARQTRLLRVAVAVVVALLARGPPLAGRLALLFRLPRLLVVLPLPLLLLLVFLLLLRAGARLVRRLALLRPRPGGAGGCWVRRRGAAEHPLTEARVPGLPRGRPAAWFWPLPWDCFFWLRSPCGALVRARTGRTLGSSGHVHVRQVGDWPPR